MEASRATRGCPCSGAFGTRSGACWLDSNEAGGAISGEAQKQDGVGRLMVKLFEVDRSGYEKVKSKNLNEGANPRLRATGVVKNRAVCGGRRVSKATEQG